MRVLKKALHVFDHCLNFEILTLWQASPWSLLLWLFWSSVAFFLGSFASAFCLPFTRGDHPTHIAFSQHLFVHPSSCSAS